MEKFTVIRDSSEKAGRGWNFRASKSCVGTVVKSLPTADYTIDGYEELFVIERKATTAEVAKNINEGRFYDELERLEQFQYPFLVCEFEVSDVLSFPEESGIPPYLWKKLRVTSNYLLRELMSIQVRYKTKVLFAGAHGHDVALSLFKRIAETCQKKHA